MTPLNHQLRHQLQNMIQELRSAIHSSVDEAWAGLGKNARKYPKIECTMRTIVNLNKRHNEQLFKALSFLFVGNTPQIRTVMMEELSGILNRGCDIRLAWIDYHQLWDVAENGICWDACFYDGETQALITLEGHKAPSPNASEQELLGDEEIKALVFVDENGIKGMLNNDDSLHFLNPKRVSRLRGVFLG